MSTDAANVLNMSDRRRGSGPQVEDGYVRIANELFEAILLKLNSYRNIKIVLAIVRKTYGYNKKEDDITISQIAEITGIHRNHVGVALRNLEQMRVIKPVHAGQHGLIIGINKHHQEWLTAPAKPRGASTNSVDAEINQNSCAEQPNQLLETTKLVDGGNQNVAHNRQSQKTIPKRLRNLPIAPHRLPRRSSSSGRPSGTRRARPRPKRRLRGSTPRPRARPTGCRP